MKTVDIQHWENVAKLNKYLDQHTEALHQILDWFEEALKQDNLGRPVRLGEFPLQTIHELTDQVRDTVVDIALSKLCPTCGDETARHSGALCPDCES